MRKSTARPNPSLKRSAIGAAPGPRSALVIVSLRGPGTAPLAPA
jgi:hypothetical protein